MAGATNIDNDATTELYYNGVDSTTAALPEESPDSGMSTTSTCGRSTDEDHRSCSEDQATPESPVAPGSLLSTQSDNAQGFLLTGIGGLGIPDSCLRVRVPIRPDYPDAIEDGLFITGAVGEPHLEHRFSSVEGSK